MVLKVSQQFIRVIISFFLLLLLLLLRQQQQSFLLTNSQMMIIIIKNHHHYHHRAAAAASLSSLLFRSSNRFVVATAAITSSSSASSKTPTVFAASSSLSHHQHHHQVVPYYTTTGINTRRRRQQHQQHVFPFLNKNKFNNTYLPVTATIRGGGGASSSPATTTTTTTRTFCTKQQQQLQKNTTTMNYQYRAIIAVGSNLGSRYENIELALKLLCDPDFDKEDVDADAEKATAVAATATAGSTFDDDKSKSTTTKVIKTSFLHNTAPMYVTNQPDFLNGVIEIETQLLPHDLLHRLKYIEGHLGRNFTTQIRNGPRPIDLDILFYDDKTVSTTNNNNNNSDEDDEEESSSAVVDVQQNYYSPIVVDDPPKLIIPHPRIQERDFVMAPLLEVIDGSNYYHPTLNNTISDLYRQLQQPQDLLGEAVEEESSSDIRIRVIPLRRRNNGGGQEMLYLNETIIMGILNVTPDSFSDGGKWNTSVDMAVKRALEMEQEGAGIIDIGGESTRPGAKEISVDEQIQRTIPVIQKIRSLSDIPISIDTRHSKVARAAIEAGADIVNDVSGGTFDPEMLSTVANLGVPIILMHMRGIPESMQSMTQYDDVVDNVATALLERSHAAEAAGIPRWMQIIDPGIGFAKDFDGNLELLRNLEIIRSKLDGIPILLGTSRKGFIGKLTGETLAADRDFGSVASVVAALCLDRSQGGCNILRVHNVKGTKQASIVMDAIRNRD